jgi:signal transduction histidine kinase
MPCARVFAAIVWLCLASFAAIVPGADAAEPKRILMLHSFGHDTSPFDAFSVSFRTQMLRVWPAQAAFYDVALEAWRPGPRLDEDVLVQAIRSRFTDVHIDLVVAVGATAAQFYVRHRDQLFSAAPLLIVGDQRTSPLALLKPGDSLVGIKAFGTPMLNGILTLLPDTTTVAVVFGNSPVERYWADAFRQEFASAGARVKFLWLNNLSLPEMRKHVAALEPGAVVLFGLLLVDAAGIPYQQHYALSELHAASRVPVFGFFESELGRGIVGGSLLPNVESGLVGAKVASRMLRGESANDEMATYVSSTEPRFDWRELNRWRIDESRLPRDSLVLFRPPSIWKEHILTVLAYFGLLIVQTGLIFSLLAQRARRRRAEGESFALSWRLLTVHEDERRRLARELHDDVTQRLARLAIDAARLEGAKSASAHVQQPSVHQELVRLSDDVHALSYRLHPSILDDLGLEEALRKECEQVNQQGRVRVDMELQSLPHNMPQDVALCLFRVAQEALRNVVRHARATVATVSLAIERGGLVLAINDNGSGFEVDAIRTRPSLGHASMDERVRLLGGRLGIRSKPGHGTTISAWVPLAMNLS